jgi:Flp pilus assembly protein TadB
VTWDRPVSDVLQDIVRNLQEIVRSEVRLARAEIRAEASHAAASGLWVTAGVVGALSSALFLMWTAVYALATVMSMWLATLVVAILLGCIGAVLVLVGVRKFKRLRPIPERTVETLRENVKWMKQSAK